MCLGIYAAAKANHLWGTTARRAGAEPGVDAVFVGEDHPSCFWLKVEEPEEEDWNALALPQDKGCILMFNHTSMFEFLMAKRSWWRSGAAIFAQVVAYTFKTHGLGRRFFRLVGHGAHFPARYQVLRGQGAASTRQCETYIARRGRQVFSCVLPGYLSP